ncbi:MAG: LysR family transcriptional regulator [Rhodospirillaceae bacterium]|nr:LysR family transcriptional regulator [Rhodospirillaceae bacterium]
MRALQAFAAAARLQSFSRAGEELGMTQSAISHQIRMLEELLRQPLFNRLHRNAVLTDAGRDLEVTLAECFERLELGLKRLEQYRKPNQVIVYTRPDFASNWLIPRLPRLRVLHPEIDVWLFSNEQTFDPVRGEIHLAILPAGSALAGLESRTLFGDLLTPLCTPALAEAPTPIASVADLMARPLLHDERREDWARWLAAAGSTATATVRGYNFGDSGALVAAARQGLGVALGSLVLAADDLRSGQLVAPLQIAIPAANDWIVALTAGALAKPKIQAFLSWLEAEAITTRNELAQWGADATRMET